LIEGIDARPWAVAGEGMDSRLRGQIARGNNGWRVILKISDRSDCQIGHDDRVRNYLTAAKARAIVAAGMLKRWARAEAGLMVAPPPSSSMNSALRPSWNLSSR
jgi:hypothetical protein